MNKKGFYVKDYLPLSAIIFFPLAIAAFVIQRIAIANPAFADSFNSSVGQATRRFFSVLTNPVRFSVFEALVILIPLFLALIIALAVRGWKRFRKCKFILGLLAFIAFVYVLYTVTFGVAYRTTPIENKIGLEVGNVDKKELYSATVTVIDEVNALSDFVERGNDGVSEMGFSMDELSKKISKAYESLSDSYGLFPVFQCRAKPIHFSSVMSRLRITGIYTFYTGESNINMSYPDYNLPFTVAHEFAHQRGILREDEANFVAFLVCAASEDIYVRYSGYLNMYEYLISALYKTDKELYKAAYAALDKRCLADIRSAYEVTERYGNSIVGDISDSVNDFYLKQNGTAGVIEYGRVTRLTVAYYADKAKQ